MMAAATGVTSTGMAAAEAVTTTTKAVAAATAEAAAPSTKAMTAPTAEAVATTTTKAVTAAKSAEAMSAAASETRRTAMSAAEGMEPARMAGVAGPCAAGRLAMAEAGQGRAIVLRWPAVTLAAAPVTGRGPRVRARSES